MCCMYTVYSGMQEWVIQIPSIPILVSVLFPSLHLKYFRIKFLLLVDIIDSRKVLCYCQKGTYLQPKHSCRADIRVTNTHTQRTTTVSSRCACAPRLNYVMTFTATNELNLCEGKQCSSLIMDTKSTGTGIQEMRTGKTNSAMLFDNVQLLRLFKCGRSILHCCK